MGEAPKKLRRVVLHTNVLVSALLFTGEVSKIVELWQKGEIVPLISRETFAELRTVLKYPKFALTSREIQSLIQNELLPYFEVVQIEENIKGVCRDPNDDKFITCSVSGSADFLVTGDKDLIALKSYKSVKIISASEFLKKIE